MSNRPLVRFLDRTTPPHILTLTLMAGVAAMNMSVFLPALPEMTAYFGTDYAVMQLSVSLYLATTALLQVAVGPISDRFGRRPVVLGSFGIFVVSVIGCLFAPNVETFLVFRMIGATVATGLVLSRAVVRDMVPQAEAASMIGYVTMGMALVPMLAPMIGGGLAAALGWQSVFVFLAVTGIGAMALIWFDQGETHTSSGLTFGQQIRDYPELLTSHRFWGYVFTAAFASGAFFAFLGGAPYVATEIFGLSSFWAGVGFGAPAIGYAVGNYISGAYSVRFGINRMILAGTIVTATGMIVASTISALGPSSALLFFGFSTTVGLGNGLTVPNANAGLLSVRPHLAGTASGLGGAIMIGGGAAMSAFAGFILTRSNSSLSLELIMAATAICAFLSMLYVLRRERQLAGR